MNSLSDYFHTDWQAMTVNDWIGTILTVVVFVLMVVAYFLVFRPKNRDRLESMKHIPFDDDDDEGTGARDGRP
ncbi:MULTISPECIES: CcoQ/FixQ family Cbb3-type cytochrome c oxidase assembly chaperone [unclassified Marichromatium]|uniref:CcoQ/FixQ family Cbb3-type cytochrome c oxidase assembly chaperone n=1 Tax=unclassified Marichromatium TaxID=2618417 RepID=UPI000F3E3647|nr:CcoQ/FixQ family Cbb3-type cytochrome c oxidase assembly chaperone [Marichromatium sp. AB32]MBO8086423.1 CcoQ/FixQ family Cbb3-type cytochrome c oxidase assembly chaperone [Marichromatium sp.]RNE94003.1 CcoQ/FixQ family Cbb3-type cytochrome c oxidase assembly chaperone [Marichromatium sp. AB32]